MITRQLIKFLEDSHGSHHPPPLHYGLILLSILFAVNVADAGLRSNAMYDAKQVMT